MKRLSLILASLVLALSLTAASPAFAYQHEENWFTRCAWNIWINNQANVHQRFIGWQASSFDIVGTYYHVNGNVNDGYGGILVANSWNAPQTGQDYQMFQCRIVGPDAAYPLTSSGPWVNASFIFTNPI